MDTSVDPQAVRIAAQRLDAVADLLTGVVSGRLGALHVADAGVRAAVDELVADVGRWQDAVRETAAALRSTADRFIDAEARAVQALR